MSGLRTSTSWGAAPATRFDLYLVGFLLSAAVVATSYSVGATHDRLEALREVTEAALRVECAQWEIQAHKKPHLSGVRSRGSRRTMGLDF